ncbi:hypothetical protein GZH47_06120 [Paenibacillus rhizovicinus]|uniref:Uncharacterized protein n=1 Tax=Paenibacillus rhizovicinus TaxID=2704463 RepID=A0A6C0NW73_9BACL|nr:hypothetical protein [Paenibacillus rhizovicinus]QHW30464.1 hypothetical protein GZH47_06120 [Paenibacillus rhizovicinus]
MRSHTLKTAFVGGAVALIVLFGIDIASSGIERIYGPVDGSAAAAQQQSAAAGGSLTMQQDTEANASVSRPEQLPENEVSPLRQLTVADAQHGRTEDEIRREYELKLQEELAKRLPGLPNMESQSTVNEVADGTAGVLQSISAKGIRMVVSFFEKVTD